MRHRSVDILMCTFRRPEVVDTMSSLARLQDVDDLRIRLIVADNDDTRSAEDVIRDHSAKMPFPTRYIHAPARNISIARNACLDAATADFVALIDDDERVEPEWLAELLATAETTGADAVFGPVYADYRGDEPHWIREGDYHSSIPVSRNGEVETGISGNALIRWSGAPWKDERFDLARGRSGGEDTEFFFRLRRTGARFSICDSAIARESVPENRLSFRWLARRRYRMGQSYAESAGSALGRVRLATAAIAKFCFCSATSLVTANNPARRNYWMLRGLLHAGVVSGCLSLRQADHYGASLAP